MRRRMRSGYWNLQFRFVEPLALAIHARLCVILNFVSDPPKNVEAGLCSDCRRARTILSDRGSSFVMCQLSANDPKFPKYPRLPVLSCVGYLRNAGPRGAQASD